MVGVVAWSFHEFLAQLVTYLCFKIVCLLVYSHLISTITLDLRFITIQFNLMTVIVCLWNQLCVIDRLVNNWLNIFFRPWIRIQSLVYLHAISDFQVRHLVVFSHVLVWWISSSHPTNKLRDSCDIPRNKACVLAILISLDDRQDWCIGLNKASMFIDLIVDKVHANYASDIFLVVATCGGILA